jgi:hypothetical protein
MLGEKESFSEMQEKSNGQLVPTPDSGWKIFGERLFIFVPISEQLLFKDPK